MEVADVQNVKVVKLMKRVDALTSRELSTTLQGLIEGGAARVLCSLQNTEYISSAGLGVILGAAKALKKANGKLGLCCPRNSYTYEILETAGLTNVLLVFESEEEAVAGLQGIWVD
jgi:anti-anti-sigma factor